MNKIKKSYSISNVLKKNVKMEIATFFFLISAFLCLINYIICMSIQKNYYLIVLLFLLQIMSFVADVNSRLEA